MVAVDITPYVNSQAPEVHGALRNFAASLVHAVNHAEKKPKLFEIEFGTDDAGRPVAWLYFNDMLYYEDRPSPSS